MREMVQRFSIRPPTLDELPFLFDSWTRSWGGDICHRARLRGREADAVYSGVRESVRQALDACDVRVVVHEEHPGVVCGWACNDGTVLRYVYVKSALRGLGLGRMLCEGCESAERLTFGRKPPAWLASLMGIATERAA